MKVGILGAGRWGQALGRLVLAAGHEPFLATHGEKKPPHILPSTDDPPQVSAACELLLVATSASEVRNAIRLAKPGPEHRIVVAGRGVEAASSRWLTDVVLEECDALRVGALAGPAPVEEILNGGLCAGVVASRYEEVRAMTVTALHSSRYRVYQSVDLLGVQLAGAMVPVLATVLGVARSLRGAGIGVHAMVLARGLEEGGRLARAMGADPLTFVGLAGAGDLVAAQAVPGNPNFDAGVALARRSDQDRSSASRPAAVQQKGGSKPVPEEVYQGPLALARALVRLAGDARVELPLTESLIRICEGGDPLDAVHQLMSRKAPTL